MEDWAYGCWKIGQAYDCNYQPFLSGIVATTTIPAYTWQGNSISSRTLAGEVGQVRRQGGEGGAILNKEMSGGDGGAVA